MLAMVTLALLPTLAQAFAQVRGGHAMTEVCTPQGMKLVVADDNASASPLDTAQAAIGHLDHCPFCANAAHSMAPPPVPLLLPLPPVGAAAAPLFLHAPRTQHAWAAAQARGPPALV
jgi:hypothetical protein